MSTWNEFRSRVSREIEDTPRGVCNKKYLRVIADSAERWDISADCANSATMSNMREIIKEARMAIEQEDRQRLEVLLFLASRLSVTDLRIILRGENRKLITVAPHQTPFGPLYRLMVTQDQYEALKQGSRRQFMFVEINR